MNGMLNKKIVSILTILGLGIVLIGTATAFEIEAEEHVNDSLFFNGSNNLTVPDHPSLRGYGMNITFRAKVEGSTFGGSGATVLGKGDSYELRTNASGNLYASIQNGVGTTFSTPAISGVPLPGWHRYDVIYNGSYLVLYRDGVPMTGTNATSTLKSNTKDLIIGSAWTGYLDQIEINGYLISK